MLKKLWFKKRFFFKFTGFAALAIIYFGTLFRASLQAIEISKNKKEALRQKVSTNSYSSLARRSYNSYSGNDNENKRKHSKIIQDHTEKSHNIYEEDKKRFIIYETEQDDNTNTSLLNSIKQNQPTSTLNPIYEYSEELQKVTEKDLYERKQHMLEICNRENLIGMYPPKSKEFFVSQGHNLIWCNVFKAASSTWMYYFNILGGYNIKYLQRTKTSPLELARIRFPRPELSELNESLSTAISFLTVREPFERLLSAYRDKLEGCHNVYYKTLSKQIIKRFRNKLQLKKHNRGPTFKEFLLYLIDIHRKQKQFDEHWAPIYNFCTPCSINYTLIAKVETFQRDTEYIIRQAGLEPLLLNKMPLRRMKTITNHSERKTSSLIEKYFTHIDRKTLDELIEIYFLDFELFGYNYTKYYKIIEPETKLLKN